MKKIIKNGAIILFFLLFTFATSFAGTNLEFALKLAKDGYPELAKKYLEKEPAKSDPDKEGRNKVFGEIELQMAKASPDIKTRTEHIDAAAGYFKQTKQTALEAADFSFSLANLIKMALKEPGLSEAERTKIASKAIPYFEDAKNQYKAYIEANKKAYEEFMDKVMNDEKGKFLNSKECKEGQKTIWSPFVIAQMRYFECVVEKTNLLPKGDASRCTGLDKIISEADDFGYLVEAPVPVATVGVYVARIYGIMADCGTDAKGNQEKAIEKFKEVLGTESSKQDAPLIRNIKSQAINGMMEMALRSSDYNSALEAMELYTSNKADIMPSNYKFGLDDFEIMLNGILINAKAFKAAQDDKERDKFKRNIDKIKLHLDKAINSSNSSGFWKKKLNSYITESALIMGIEIKDSLILLQLADEKKNDKNFEEAIVLYEKALAGKILGPDKLSKKPGAFNSLAVCAFRVNKPEIGVKALKEFFTEFPPTDPKYKTSLKEQFEIGSKNYFKLASAVYAYSKKDEDKEIVMKALDILELFFPDGVVFTKIDAFVSSGNFIDAIKLADSIKNDSVDYDKALYYKGLAQFNYSRLVKSKNNDEHNDLSIKLANDGIKTFEDLIAFIKTDPTDIIQEKKEARKVYAKESKKLIAFFQLSLENHKNALTALAALNEDYKKDPDDAKSSNRLYVLQGMMSSYSKLFNIEKEVAVKQDYVLKCDDIFTNEFIKLDLKAFETKDLNRKAEDRKEDLVANFYMVIGMMLITNPSKDTKLIAKGSGYIEKGSRGKKVENIDLFLAQKFLDLKDFENATICLQKVKKEYEGKGWSSQLKPEDFVAIKKKLISDDSRTFFKNNFENHAFPPQDTTGQEIKKNTRDYGRLKINFEYSTVKVDPSKDENAEEKKLRERIQETMKKEPWPSIIASGEMEILKKKLNEFQRYLGIIDDLALCSERTLDFESAIKFYDLLRANNPGILADDIKIANLTFNYGKFLMKEKDTTAKSLEQFQAAYKMYLDIKARLEFNKTTELYLKINEKRLVSMAMIYKLKEEKDMLEQIHRALSILYTNPEVYVEYINIFAVLEEMKQLPPELKPLTPEEIRKVNEDNLEKDRIALQKMIEERNAKELKDLEIRNKGSVGMDASFFPIEMRDLSSEILDLYVSYYEKIKGAKPLIADPGEKDVLDAFNLVLRDPNLHKSLPPELNRNDPVVANYIKTLDDYTQMQGAKASGTTQTVSINRKLLEICFPQLPKIPTN